MRVCTVHEMRDCDRRAAELYGLSDEILMENAGDAVYDVVMRRYGVDGRRFVVLCGGGNNGGDGLVVARKLNSVGAEVRVFLLAAEDSLSGASAKNLAAIARAGIPLQRLTTIEELYLGRSCDVVIDAMLGTGLSRQPAGLFAEAIELVNATRQSVVSVDIPSGVNGDTGMCQGVAIRAEVTVTFGLPKRGNLLPPGRELCGDLYVSHISFPPSLYASVGNVEVNQPPPLPPRRLESHKGDYGNVLFVAGARTYVGAPVFAAMSFLKAGGGYARLAVPSSIASLMSLRAPEAVIVPLEETSDGSASIGNLEALAGLAEVMDMLVVGPGLSLNDESQELARQLVARVDRPVLVDGDGLSAIAGHHDVVRERKAATVLTPHLGEVARLLGIDFRDGMDDRVEVARRTAQIYGTTVVLKGSTTLIATADGDVAMNLSGNPGMATAGCGDVLSGTIPALIGAGLHPDDAARCGAFIHGMAGDLAAEQKGMDGLVATDVMEQLPQACKSYREGFDNLRRNYYGRICVI
jgi:hydroxyethylthiazole kinase-like uncharacterized protein yjeF